MLCFPHDNAMCLYVCIFFNISSLIKYLDMGIDHMFIFLCVYIIYTYQQYNVNLYLYT